MIKVWVRNLTAEREEGKDGIYPARACRRGLVVGGGRRNVAFNVRTEPAEGGWAAADGPRCRRPAGSAARGTDPARGGRGPGKPSCRGAGQRRQPAGRSAPAVPGSGRALAAAVRKPTGHPQRTVQRLH